MSRTPAPAAAHRAIGTIISETATTSSVGGSSMPPTRDRRSPAPNSRNVTCDSDRAGIFASAATPNTRASSARAASMTVPMSSDDKGGGCRYHTTTLRGGSENTASTAVVEAYGARLAVTAPDVTTLRAILGGLPTGWSVSDEAESDNVSWRFAVLRDANGYRVIQGDGYEQVCGDLDLAVWLLRTQMRRYVGHHSENLVFVHAGVVAYQGRAILLPGRSFAGKSTLVVALVEAGADYYSDEFAMLDEVGRVAKYLEPIQLRGPEGPEVLTLDSDTPQHPVPVGLVAVTVYTPGAKWLPQRLSTGQGVLAMMGHAAPARDRPAKTLSTLRLALADAEILQGDRGEADETARALLDVVALQS